MRNIGSEGDGDLVKYTVQSGAMSDLGRKIAGGLGHHVYEHAHDEKVLVKVPTVFRRVVEKAGYSQTAEDLAFVHEHFGRWLPPTAIEPSEQTRYRILQARVESPERISAALLGDHQHLQEEMLMLLDQNRSVLGRHGKSLDLYGFAGLMHGVRHAAERRIRVLMALPAPTQKPILANVLSGTLTGAPDADASGLYAVDFSLLHKHEGSTLERIRSELLLKLHRLMLRRQFGMEL